MSVDENKVRLNQLLAQFPGQLRMLRSPNDVNDLNVENIELHGPYDNGSSLVISAVEEALRKSKQVAISAAGPDQLLILIAKSGTRLFRF